MADFALYGTDLFGEAVKPPSRGKVSDDFIVAPFTVLNAREGFWQERKRMWASYGIKGEVGRDSNQAVGNLFEAFNKYDVGLGKKGGRTETTTSIFDPVLTELAYKWFCPSLGR